MTSKTVHIPHRSHRGSLSLTTWQAIYSAVPTPIFVCQPDADGQASQILVLNSAAQHLIAPSTASDEFPENQRIADLLQDREGQPAVLQHGSANCEVWLKVPNGQRTAAVAGCQQVDGTDPGLLVVTLSVEETPTVAAQESDGVLVDQDFRHLLDFFQVPVTVLDESCRIILMNPAGAANLQMTPQDVMGRFFGEILPDFAEVTQQRVNSVLEQHQQLTFEDSVPLHDGVRWFRTVMQPMQGTDGRRLVWTVSYEFTEELETQQALIETNEQIRSLSSNIPGAIFQLAQTTNGQLRIPYLGPALVKFLGPAEEAARTNPRMITNIMHPEDRRSFRESMLHSIRKHSDWQWEGRFLDGDDVRWIQAAARVRTSPGGEVLWDGVIMDVTDKHRLDESLQSQEQLFRTLVEACHDGIVVHNGDRFLFANPAAVRMFRGDSPDQLTGRRVLDVVCDESQAAVQNHIDRLLDRTEMPYTEVRLKRFDGTTMMVEGIGAPVIYRGQQCAQVVMRDVTERRAAQRAIQQSEERFRTLFDQAPIGIALIDADGCARMSNPALQAFFGNSENLLRQQPITQLLVRDEQNPLPLNWQQLLTELPDGTTTELQFLRSDGSQVWGSLTVTALPDNNFESTASLLMLQDISDRKQAEDHTRHLQKLEAIGHLTGGVAHDFNNLLAVISGNLELLSCQMTSPALLRLAQNAATAADRGARLTRQLLAFGRRAALRPGIIDLNQIIDEWQHLLHRTIPATIHIEAQLHRAPLYGYVDQAELENALLNLALNARDAMPDGGCLTIRTSLISAVDLPADMDLESIDHISIQFHDTGCGMEDSVRDRAFDPFFTTKKAGAGSGLGLSMVYGFMKQSGGHVTIRSRPQQGTTVQLLLPRARESAAKVPLDSLRTPTLPGSGEGETILVVEDNSDVLDVILRQLTMLGYQTIHASCGADALEIISGDVHLDILLTDIVMPGELQGSQLVERTRQLRPEIGVLVMSGYTDQMNMIPIEGGVRRLAKPFSVHDLATALRQVLQQLKRSA